MIWPPFQGQKKDTLHHVRPAVPLRGVGDWEKETNIDPPILIETKTAKLFDKTGKGVIAYGEVIQKESTPGEAMIPFEITLDYKDLTRKAKYLLIVASAIKIVI